MKVTLMKLAEIRPYEGNPRNNESAIAAVAESIRQFGWRQPIVVDKDKVIIAGHTRYHAAVSLNAELVPVHVAKDLTPEQARLYRIVDNRTADLAEWDMSKLRDELAAFGDTDINLHAFCLSVEQWPELAVPDFEGLETDTDKSAGVRSNLLAIGKYRIAMTDAEEETFIATVTQYAEEAGTLFGFARWLLVKAGITVREEVSSGEGQVASLV